jgi:nucleotide-binding universal stress UspA family protein
MLPIHKILLPVDFSRGCLRMAAYAKALATTYGAELTLLHVVNPMYSFPATAISGPAMVPIPNSVIEDRENQLEQFAEAELRGLPVRRLVYDGDPEAQIAGFVSSEDVQLVVMATHGYGVLRRFLIGSVTAKVLHDVACPVLTGVHLDPHHDGSPRFSNILCAIDLDSHDQATLSWASQFAADVGAQFGIVHVVADEERSAQAGDDLKKMQDAAGAASASVHIQEGETANTVCSLAESLGADLLVIGRGAREDMGTLTTTAYAIIRQSPCAVVSV